MGPYCTYYTFPDDCYKSTQQDDLLEKLKKFKMLVEILRDSQQLRYLSLLSSKPTKLENSNCVVNIIFYFSFTFGSNRHKNMSNAIIERDSRNNNNLHTIGHLERVDCEMYTISLYTKNKSARKTCRYQIV